MFVVFEHVFFKVFCTHDNGKVDTWTPDGSFELSDQGKMTFRLFRVLLEPFVCLEKKLVDIGSR